MTFKTYQSKPIERLAHCITADDVISRQGDKLYQIRFKDGRVYPFVAHQAVETGDYVVYLNDEDIYHCSAEVFRERNIVEDEPSSN